MSYSISDPHPVLQWKFEWAGSQDVKQEVSSSSLISEYSVYYLPALKHIKKQNTLKKWKEWQSTHPATMRFFQRSKQLHGEPWPLIWCEILKDAPSTCLRIAISPLSSALTSTSPRATTLLMEWSCPVKHNIYITIAQIWTQNLLFISMCFNITWTQTLSLQPVWLFDWLTSPRHLYVLRIKL